MVITLIGYRGSGKSTIARPLAQRLGWSWVDADAVIEERAGKTIREIFLSEGEPVFRKLECQVMSDLLHQDRLVIAAGGGAILNPGTRQLIRESGLVVWLQASVKTLAERIAGDRSTAERRPNLTVAGGLEEIASVLTIREPLYRECAMMTADTDSLTESQIVDLIFDHLPSIGKESAAQ